MTSCSQTSPPVRRGGTSIAMLIVVATIGLLLIGMVHTSTRDQVLTVRRLESVRSFYAAEAGVNMAMRELVLDSDEDADGVIGSISDDGDDANDPTISNAAIQVNRQDTGSDIALTSHGRSGDSTRSMTLTVTFN